MASFAPGNFVDLVQKHDARVLDAIDCHARDLVHINEPLLFFLDQVFEGLIHLHFPFLGALAEDVRQHVFDVDVHLLHALVGDDFKGRKIPLAHFDFNHAVVELALTQLLAQFFASAVARITRGCCSLQHETGLRRLRRTRRNWRQ